MKHSIVLVLLAAAATVYGSDGYADGSGDLSQKSKTRFTTESASDTDARRAIERYWDSVMVQCGGHRYFAETENAPDEATPYTNDNTVMTGDPGATVAIVEIKFKGPAKVEGESGNKVADAQRLNGYTWIGSAYYERVLLRIYPLTLSLKLSPYGDLIGADIPTEMLQSQVAPADSDDEEQGQGKTSDSHKWMNKWSSWGESDLSGANSGYSPWATVYFFKRSGAWYLGNPDDSDEEPVLLQATVDANATHALKCSDIPK